MSGEITHLTLTEVARAIRDRELSSEEVTIACLERIARHGEALHCIAGLEADRALDDAREADADLAAGRLRGPLHGVPLAHKDMFYRKGRISACGSKIQATYVPDHTSTALARLDRAGALDIARLNMVEFALGITGHNEVVGTPRNPWNPAHVTGGSSSGSAVAVASRMVYGALGSDTGGSIRMPAGCCGLAGIKPTYGRVSRHGAMPLSFSLDHVGPLARTVEDAALMLQAIAGQDANDPTTVASPVPNYLSGLDEGVRGLRIAVPTNYLYDPVSDEVRKLMEASLEVYRGLGAEVVEVAIPGIESSNVLVNMIIATEAASFHARWLRERLDDYGRQTRGRMLAGMFYPATRYIEALRARGPMLKVFEDAVFAKADMLHVPILPIPVPTIEDSDVGNNPGFVDFLMAFGHCLRPFNYLGLPSVAVPAGFTTDGLPTGFQLVGRAFDEATVIRAASAYEREARWVEKAPPLNG